MSLSRHPEGFLRSQWKRTYWGLIPVTIGALAVLLSNWAVGDTAAANELELRRATHFHRLAQAAVNPVISLITFDSETKRRLPKWEDGELSRLNYARLIRKLRKAGAKALLIDILFDQPKGQDDVELRNALHEPGPMGITLASVIQEDTILGVEGEPDDQRWTYADLGHLGVGFTSDSPRAAANASFDPLGIDIGGVLYREDRARSSWILHAALSVVLQFRGVSAADIRFDADRGELRAGGLEWSLQGNDAIFVDWTAELRPFPEHDLATVLLDDDEAELREAFGGRIVIVGMQESGIDQINLGDDRIFGDEFLAQMANTLLLAPSERMHDAESSWHYLWCALLGFAAALAGMSRRLFWTAFGLGCLLVLSVGLPEVLTRLSGVILETAAPVGTVVAAFALGSAVRLAVPAPGRPTGSEFEATALIVDLKGSTELLRDLGPQAFRQQYSTISEKIAQIARSFEGVVERTTGDGALLLFTAERGRLHAVAAVAAAEAIEQAIRDLGPQLAITAGLESGLLTGGYVTEGGHRSWSSAGSALNLAKRLQDSAGDLKKSLLIGPAAARLVEGHRKVLSMGEIEVQGFEGKVPVWTLTRE